MTLLSTIIIVMHPADSSQFVLTSTGEWWINANLNLVLEFWNCWKSCFFSLFFHLHDRSISWCPYLLLHVFMTTVSVEMRSLFSFTKGPLLWEWLVRSRSILIIRGWSPEHTTFSLLTLLPLLSSPSNKPSPIKYRLNTENGGFTPDKSRGPKAPRDLFGVKPMYKMYTYV